MYRKIRFQLTLLFTLVTSILLAALLGISFVWFASSSLSMRVSSFAAQAATVTQDMDEQNVLTVDWLNAKEETSNFGIYLWDNETPFFHNQNHGAPSLPNADYRTAYDFSPVSENDAVFIGRRGLFPEILLYRGQQIRNGGILRFDFLQSMEPFSVYLRRSFLFCLLLYLAASSLLGCFCRYFTGRLLSPLSASQEAQNRFISAASHELRTPLAVILANASACEKAPRSRQKPFFSVIAKEGAQMSDLLEQLLTLSKADAHGLELQIEKTDLQTLLLDIYEHFLPVAAESGRRLHIRLPETEIPLCECDPARIQQICHILLHNALSHTPPGTHVTLFLETETDGKEVGIGVADDGEGIPETEQAKIFERFYRGNDQKNHHGLGLAVAKEIAAAHRGTLSVSSVSGGGACFLLKLPLSFIRS